jgi:hypothetical protein
MKLHLVLPGLIWPNPNSSALFKGLNLPAFERLLGCGQSAMSPGQAFEPWIARSFALTAGPGHPPAFPYGALRRMGESGTPINDGHWLCADPVHLHFARERLLLADADDLDISRAEATTLLEGLNQLLVAEEVDFIRFEAKSPRRWYLRLKSSPQADFSPLNDVIGRPVASFLPGGPDGKRWQKILNEIQVFLHNHPVNQAREASGRRMINGVWFWGQAPLTARTVAPAPLVLTRNRLVRGMAVAAGIRPDVPKRLPQLDAMVVLDALLRPSLYLDLDTWRAELPRIEADWFSPALEALRGRRLDEILISAPGDRMVFELRVRAIDLWKFWRRPLSLDQIVHPA